MPTLDTEAGGTASGARRVRDNTGRLFCTCGLALAFCLSLPTHGHAQAATASRETRTTLNRSKNMPELNTVAAPVTAPAARTPTEDTSIRRSGCTYRTRNSPTSGVGCK
jgi:hypothetical protein